MVLVYYNKRISAVRCPLSALTIMPLANSLPYVIPSSNSKLTSRFHVSTPPPLRCYDHGYTTPLAPTILLPIGWPLTALDNPIPTYLRVLGVAGISISDGRSQDTGASDLRLDGVDLRLQSSRAAAAVE